MTQPGRILLSDTGHIAIRRGNENGSRGKGVMTSDRAPVGHVGEVAASLNFLYEPEHVQTAHGFVFSTQETMLSRRIQNA
jgi:hypothetical protein